MTDATERTMRLRYLLSLPWTINVAPGMEARSKVMRIAELPDFLYVVEAGTPEPQASSEFWNALDALLASIVEYDDPIHTPLGLPLPWSADSIEQPETTPEDVQRKVGSNAAPYFKTESKSETFGLTRPQALLEMEMAS